MYTRLRAALACEFPVQDLIEQSVPPDKASDLADELRSRVRASVARRVVRSASFAVGSGVALSLGLTFNKVWGGEHDEVSIPSTALWVLAVVIALVGWVMDARLHNRARLAKLGAAAEALDAVSSVFATDQTISLSLDLRDGDHADKLQPVDDEDRKLFDDKWLTAAGRLPGGRSLTMQWRQAYILEFGSLDTKQAELLVEVGGLGGPHRSAAPTSERLELLEDMIRTQLAIAAGDRMQRVFRPGQSVDVNTHPSTGELSVHVVKPAPAVDAAQTRQLIASVTDWLGHV